MVLSDWLGHIQILHCSNRKMLLYNPTARFDFIWKGSQIRSGILWNLFQVLTSVPQSLEAQQAALLSQPFEVEMQELISCFKGGN